MYTGEGSQNVQECQRRKDFTVGQNVVAFHCICLRSTSFAGLLCSFAHLNTTSLILMNSSGMPECFCLDQLIEHFHWRPQIECPEQTDFRLYILILKSELQAYFLFKQNLDFESRPNLTSPTFLSSSHNIYTFNPGLPTRRTFLRVSGILFYSSF